MDKKPSEESKKGQSREDVELDKKDEQNKEIEEIINKQTSQQRVRSLSKSYHFQ